ncbi:hypothetical protein P3X46_023156 [Hevea brasiliensis]|uniref:UspA domain-containing protein n=1 Tax=Hevea brasiliensis TaxID=3981 RepID=A0ABQ9LBW8_HEVBR|nr:uncharacterized protein LOC110660685 [Hevea brasiliensis]KAJ9163494.1 hypothetical protein P3X46_023156 [Hevea brasiliensis]
MASSRTRSPKLCISRSVARIRVRSPSLRGKPTSNSVDNDQKIEFLGNGMEDFVGENGYGNGNKVMAVVDSSLEAKGALQWALSHTVQSQDTIVLLYISKLSNSKQGPECKLKVKRACELLHSMKNMCQRKRPGVQVEVAIRPGKEKGPIIVEEAKQQRVSLLVLGQRKRSIMWRLMKRWAGKRKDGGAVEYCIQNSSCMTIAVRRKGKKLGGYLITTKRHKNFWLLA